MVSILLTVLVLLVVAGFIVWVIESAPFISATVKPFMRWAVIVVAGFILLRLLLKLFGVSLAEL